MSTPRKEKLRVGVPAPATVPPTAGYSGTPLWKKLGYADGLHAVTLGGPAHYQKTLGLPPATKVTWSNTPEPGAKFVHVFATEASTLRTQLGELRRQIAPDGVVWISWPKKSSGVVTDLVEDKIRALALPLGFVDIKVCAVDDTWSGLKLMIRRSER
jgi:hypothetical protein